MDLEVVRRRAFEAGYRMLGTRADAEDVAQEALLRMQGPLDRGEVDNPEAFATTVATRIAIDHLRSAQVRRETYVGPWLPEPLIEPGDPAELADSLSYGLLVVLETLAPVERAAFLLHDVFGFGYDELARTLDRTEPACRQLVSRARRRVRDDRPRRPVDGEEHQRLLERFLAAAREGDLEGLLALLAPDVVLVSDGGANARAARHPILGALRVARLARKIMPRYPTEARWALLNGQPGFVLEHEGRRYLAGTVEVVDGRISRIYWIRNPDKLG
jgi:RNA polymerase sigma-70 factor (ECF subfamily)